MFTNNVTHYPPTRSTPPGFVTWGLVMNEDESAKEEQDRRDTMLEQALKLYTASMATGATGVLPHYVGPPGSGKSTVFKQLANLLGVQLHTINVSRINPLGLEGMEMPDKENSALQLLISEMWTKAKDGDIYLFDEFLRGFPEVYNGLLDIFTSREVAGYSLPRVFLAAASNTVATYDPALEDRLLHLPVPDPRSSKSVRRSLADRIISEIGLSPDIFDTTEMHQLMDKEVLPTFNMLDSYKAGAKRNQGLSFEGSSIRKLIAQAQLRQVESMPLKELIAENNYHATRLHKLQYIVLLDGKASNVPNGYESFARDPKVLSSLTSLQRTNLELNLQLIEMEQVKKESTEGTDEDGNLLDNV